MSPLPPEGAHINVRVFKGNFRLSQKIKILDKCVFPVLSYGCQTWIYTKEVCNFIEIQQRKFLRSILKIKRNDRMSNRLLLEKTKSKSWLQKMKILKWNWGGHLTRLPEERWTNRLMDWYPRNGKRKKGRPSQKWEKEFYEYAGPTWQRVARERNAWAFARNTLYE